MRRLLLLSVSLCLSACNSDEVGADPTAAPVTGSEDRAELARREGLRLKQFDLNRDNEPDVFKFYRSQDDPKNPGNTLELLVRKELDINHDSKIDIIRFYNESQQVIEERADLDFDGRIDGVAYFKDGQLQRREIDVNYDTKPDMMKFYVDGKLEHVESDRDSDGRIDTWEYFINGELDRVGTDEDGDGIADSWERKQQSEELVGGAEEETSEAPGEPSPSEALENAAPEPEPAKE